MKVATILNIYIQPEDLASTSSFPPFLLKQDQSESVITMC